MSDFQEIIEEFKILEEDGIPKNIKKKVEDIISCLADENVEDSTRVSKALAILDEISNDINLSSHIRTQFWNLTCMLESM